MAGDEQPGRRPDSLPSAFFMWIMTLQLMEMSSIRLSDSHSSGDQKPRLVGWTKWQRNWDESRREEPGKCLDGSLKSECFRVQRQSRLAVDQRCNHLLKAILRPRFDPWVGKIPWKRKRLPTPIFWPGEFHLMLYGDLNGKEIQKRGDICIVDSLCCTIETNTTL